MQDLEKGELPRGSRTEKLKSQGGARVAMIQETLSESTPLFLGSLLIITQTQASLTCPQPSQHTAPVRRMRVRQTHFSAIS